MNDVAKVRYDLGEGAYGVAVFNLVRGRVVSLAELWVVRTSLYGKTLYGKTAHVIVKYSPDLRIIALESTYISPFRFNRERAREYEKLATELRSKAQEHI